jgi:DNA-binding PadR family transcriptional regulator
MAEINPTQTSYAVLGLLAIRPWTAYELARQSERSLRWFFPRAERAVYLEAKRLVGLGWARASTTRTGRRTSTEYRITRAGERALHAWLGAASTATQIESEAALKVFFADRAGTEDVRATIDGVRRHAAAALERLAAMAAASADSEFPERARTNVLSMRLVADLQLTLQRWADWADAAVDVLAGGDPSAIDEQTQHVLDSIATATPARPSCRDPGGC